MTYSPQYVDPADIPVQIPDDYSQSQKLDALEYAESSIELDVNDGESIDEAKQITGVEAAVKQLATAELIRGAESPDDVTLGDLDDSGSSASNLAEDYEDGYQEQVDRIIASGVFDDEKGGESNSPYFKFTHQHTDSHSEY
jgi:hypothetical protein